MVFLWFAGGISRRLVLLLLTQLLRLTGLGLSFRQRRTGFLPALGLCHGGGFDGRFHGNILGIYGFNGIFMGIYWHDFMGASMGLHVFLFNGDFMRNFARQLGISWDKFMEY